MTLEAIIDKIELLILSDNLDNRKIGIELMKSQNIKPTQLSRFKKMNEFTGWEHFSINEHLITYLSKDIPYGGDIEIVEKQWEEGELESFFELLKDFRFVRSLCIRYSKLKTLPENFKELAFLNEIDFYGNCFEEIPSVLKHIPNLSLDIRFNHIQKIQEDISEFSNIRSAYFGENPICENEGVWKEFKQSVPFKIW